MVGSYSRPGMTLTFVLSLYRSSQDVCARCHSSNPSPPTRTFPTGPDGDLDVFNPLQMSVGDGDMGCDIELNDMKVK